MAFCLFIVYWFMLKKSCRFTSLLARVIWKVVPYCMWYIWRELNAWSFEDVKRNLPDINCFSLKLCWIGCQLCDVILYVRFVIWLIIIITNLHDWLYCPHLYTFCILGWLLWISIKCITYQKKIMIQRNVTAQKMPR